jgi:nitrate/nitrite transporter NarK
MFFIVGGAAATCSAGFYMLPETFQGTKATEEKVEQNAQKAAHIDHQRRNVANATTVTNATDATSKGQEKAAIPIETGNKEPTAWEVYRPLLSDPNQQGVMIMNFAVFCSYSSLMTVFPLHASEVLGASGTASVIGGLFASGAVIGFVGAPLGGYLADKIGRKNTVVPAGIFISIGALMTTMTTPETATISTMLPAILVWGVGNSMVNPGLSAFAADIAQDVKTRSQALSLSRMAADSAFLVCPISLGMLAQYSSCATALFTTAGLIGAANVVFALRTTEQFRSGE